MINQLRVENSKLLRFKALYAIVLVMVAMSVFAGLQKWPGSTDSLYYVFSDTIQDVSLFFLIALFASWFVGSDFSDRTINREIVTGCSRWSVVITRLLPSFCGSAMIHICYVGANCLAFAVKAKDFSGFSMADVAWGVVVLLQIFALQSIFVLITFVFHNVFAAITASTIVEVIMCNIMRNFVSADIYKYSCFHLADSTDATNLMGCGIAAVITIVVVVTITCVIFNKKDI